MCQSSPMPSFSIYVKNVIFLLFFSLGPSYAQTDPNSVSGLQVWLSADSSLVQTGATVQQWTDLSGNGNHFVSPNAGFNPLKVSTSTLNNKPYLVFDGTDKLVSTNNFSLGDATIFVVATQNTGDNPFSRLLDHGYDTGFWIGKGNANQIGGGFHEAAPPYGNFESASDNIVQVLTFVRTAATTTYYKNGLLFGIPTRTTSGSATLTNKIVLGATITNDNFGKKNIYEVLIYDGALTSSEMDVVYAYLGEKYSTPLSLGPDIVSTDYCGVTINAPNGFSDYLWSTGQTSASIVATTPGDYWLEAKDSLGLITRDTIHVSFPVVAPPNSLAICPASSITWNTNLSSPYTFLWSTGATTPSLTISVPGDYWVQVTDGAGCVQSSDTLSFSVDNYINMASLGNDTSLCAGNTIGLQVGAAETVSYLWQNGATTPTIPVSSSGSYFVQTTNVNGCVANDTILVSISGTAPNALFDEVTGCEMSALSFTDLSSGVGSDPVTSWNWDFGDGLNSTNQNPAHNYANSGAFVVQLDILSAGGCGASYTDTVLVFDAPIANFLYTGSCTGNVTNFIDNSIFGDTTFASYAWDFGQPNWGAANGSSAPSPSRTFTDSGTYLVSFSVTDFNGCADTISMQVTINQSPEPSFTAEEVCAGNAVNFVNTSVYEPNSTILWSFGDGTTTTTLNPSKTFLGFGTNGVDLQITGLNGCSAVFSQDITVHPFPTPVLNLDGICINTFVTMAHQSTIGLGTIDSVWWVVNQSDTTVGDTALYLIPNANQQQVVLYVESDFGCLASTSQFFMANEMLDANFALSSSTIATGSTIDFQNTSINGDIFFWDFGDGNTSTAESPSHSFSTVWSDSTLPVVLVAQTNSGCSDTLVRLIELKSSRLDLEIGNVLYQPDGKFAIVGVELVNKGTVVIETADLLLSNERGAVFKENWTGKLQPNEKEIFIFTSKPFYQISDDDELLGFYCVYGWPILAGVAEIDTTNNRFCKAIEGKKPILMTVYPNPVSGTMNLRLLISVESQIELGLFDLKGRRIEQIFSGETFETGVFDYQINMQNIEEGTYFLRMISEGETSQQRIVVVH